MRISGIIIWTIFLGGCAATSKHHSNPTVPESHKDVFVLSVLVSDYLKNTHSSDIDLNVIDSSGRVTKNFEKIEMTSRGGYISVYYKLSSSKDNEQIELTPKEKELMNKLRWSEKKFSAEYDGEIQLDFGERGYRIRKIVVKKAGATANTNSTR